MSFVPIMDEILLTYTKGQSLIQWVKATPHFISITLSPSSEQTGCFSLSSSTSVSSVYSLKNNILVVIKQHDILAEHEVTCISCSSILSFDHRARYKDFAHHSFSLFFHKARIMSRMKSVVDFK